MKVNSSGQFSDSLVTLAPNPYLAFGLRLGRDELYALAISVAATLMAGLALNQFAPNLPTAVRAAILAVVGPAAEKPGLFLHYLKDAVNDYRHTAVADRRSLGHYLRRAISQGWPSLRADLLYHDPSYTVLLWSLLRLTGAQSVSAATLLAGASFVTAVMLASALEVISVDLRYRRLLRRLRRAGFVVKTYCEARFLVDPDDDEQFAPENVLDRLRKHFGLRMRTSYEYRDRYLTEHTLAVYNGRKPYLRFRQRRRADGIISKQAVQVMYTRPREARGGKYDLYRCFITRKEKAGYDLGLDQAMPWTIAEIPDESVRRLVRKFGDRHPDREVRFRRLLAMNPDGVFLSVDISPEERCNHGAYWLEVKTRGDLEELREISAYIAWKLPVRATTRSKGDGFGTAP